MEENGFLRLCFERMFNPERSKEMKFHRIKGVKELRDFFLLWSTQSVSQLGSAMTSFALTLWLYEKTGSSLSTAALTICSYAPYVVMSIFAGALTDRMDKKKSMLLCDLLAAVCTVAIFVLFSTGTLAVGHLYALNAFSGLMNTVQQPASEVAMTLVIPKAHYQTASGLTSLSRSLISILTPLLATALYTLVGLKGVIAVDLISFAAAFVTLLCFIRLPPTRRHERESVLMLAREGLAFLRRTPLVLTLILFMAGINFTSSAFDAALPGLVLPNPRGGSTVLGAVTSCAGLAMVLGSLLASLLPKPKDRVRAVYLTMLFSMSTENFVLAFTRNPIFWCIAQGLGWIVVPIMSANLDVILRSTIPVELQGRVYACRNTLQFFTIPIGLFWGGWMVDAVCEPLMAAHQESAALSTLFGQGKGAGAAMVLFILGLTGCLFCLLAGRKLKKYHFSEC